MTGPRPEPDDPERQERLAARARVWRRRNWVLNILMVVAVVAIYVRSCS